MLFRSLNGNGTLHIGVIENPLLESTFTPISSFTDINTTYKQRFVDFSNYTGTEKYIAFKWENGTDNKLLLDDVQLSVNSMLEECLSPAELMASDITENSASITWYPQGYETVWIMEYKLSSENDYGQSIICYANNYALLDLLEGTTYDLRLSSLCDGTGYSAWTEISFTTMAFYTITPEAGPNGTIDPSEPVTVRQGESQIFTFTPDANYRVKHVLLNGDSVGNDSTYTVENIQADATIFVEFEEILNVHQYLLDNSILIYPNPTHDKLTIQLSIPFEKVEITNLLGQLIYSTEVNDTAFSIHVADYHSGIYFVRLIGEQGVVTKKFIKE